MLYLFLDPRTFKLRNLVLNEFFFLFSSLQSVFSIALPSPHLAFVPQERDATMEIQRETKQNIF